MENNNKFRIVKQDKRMEHSMILSRNLYLNNKRKLENSIDNNSKIDLTDSESVLYATAMIENYFGKISYKEYEDYVLELYGNFERLAKLDYEMSFINNSENVKQDFIYKVLENSQVFKNNKNFNGNFKMLIKDSLMIMGCLLFDIYEDSSIIKYNVEYYKVCNSNLEKNKQKIIK